MEPEMMGLLPLIIDFFNNIDVLMLILVRVSGFLIFLPILSSMNIPLQFRLFFAFVVSVAIFSSGNVTSATYHDSPAGLIMLIIAELITGALMGYALYFMFNVILFAGQLIDFSVGFSMVNVLDPIQQIQVPIMGNVMYLLASALLIATGGLNELLKTFFYSYKAIPIGTAFILGNKDLAWYAMMAIGTFLLLAMRIALPVVGALLLVTVCLGIVVKASPQMNVFVVGMPLKVFLGLILISTVMLPSFNAIYEQVFNAAELHMTNMLEGMAINGTASP
ncbi:MAG: flagellar biosynthetic protein FliR [Defluviitaleaceae bacterium]|nr:flagellar biosynthetic protein FliR [Defluviitaleaceae bacterium]